MLKSSKGKKGKKENRWKERERKGKTGEKGKYKSGTVYGEEEESVVEFIGP